MPKKNGHGGRRKGAGGKPVPRLPAYSSVGAPPDDPLARQAWMADLLAITAHQVATDTKMTDRARRLELRQIAKAMAPLVPRERLRAAEKLVRGDIAAATAATDPQLERWPEKGEA